MKSADAQACLKVAENKDRLKITACTDIYNFLSTHTILLMLAYNI